MTEATICDQRQHCGSLPFGLSTYFLIENSFDNMYLFKMELDVSKGNRNCQVSVSVFSLASPEGLCSKMDSDVTQFCCFTCCYERRHFDSVQ